MDGPVQLGVRVLSVEFQSDRHGGERINSAYQRLEMLANARNVAEDTVQAPQESPHLNCSLVTEKQG